MEKYDYSKPFTESFIDFVKGHKDVVLTQEKFRELVSKNDELTSKCLQLEQKLSIACSVIRYILDGDLLPSRIEMLEFANNANARIKEVK